MPRDTAPVGPFRCGHVPDLLIRLGADRIAVRNFERMLVTELAIQGYTKRQGRNRNV